MSKSHYITGLRAVEQVLATDASDVRRIYAEYQTANPRVEAIIKSAQGHGIEIQPANRARLAQMSGEARHQGVIAEVQRSTTMDEAGLRSMCCWSSMVCRIRIISVPVCEPLMRPVSMRSLYLVTEPLA
jgi:tRNA G18 (ribose-2'-O)-methylase SpoU